MKSLNTCKANLRLLAYAGQYSEIVIPKMLECLIAQFDSKFASFYWCDSDGQPTSAYMSHFMGQLLRMSKGSLAHIERDMGMTVAETVLFGELTNNSKRAFQNGFEKTELFTEYFAKMGVRWQLDGVVRSAERPFGLVNIARAGDYPNYSDLEADQLQELLPYFVHAVKADQSLPQVRSVGNETTLLTAEEAPGSAVFLLDDHGEIRGKTDHARALVAMAFVTQGIRPNVGEDFSDNSEMWTRLQEVCTALHAALDDESSVTYPVANRSTRWGDFELRAYRVTAPGTGIKAAIILQHTLPAEAVSLDRIRKLPLSIRQKELCWMVVKGLQQNDIAQAMGLSLPTVKEYLRNVYDKLDVDSKPELVRLLSAN